MIEIGWPPKSPKETIRLEGDEERWYLDACRRAHGMEPGPELSALAKEVRTILELVLMLGASFVDERRVESPQAPSGVSPERALATYSLMQEMEKSGFRFPAAAKEQMGGGQLTLNEASPRLLDSLPDFDGATYLRALDHERLGAQLVRVGKLMADGQWRTLAEISAETEDPEASVSARLRDLRKRKFGGHTVERERIDGGLWKYRVVLESHARPWDDAEEIAAASA